MDTFWIKYGHIAAKRVDLSARLAGAQSAKNLIGTVAESVVAHLFNAEPYEGSAIPTPHADLRPDLLLRRQAALVEVKASRHCKHLHVTEDQLRAYEWANQHSLSPIRQPRVFYAFFGYQLPGPPRLRKLNSYKTVASLLKAVLEGISCCVLLDLPIVLRLAEKYGSTKECVTPLSPMLGTWAARYRLTPSRLKVFAMEPLAAVRALGLRGRWTTWKRDPRQCILPFGVLPPFPVAAIWRRRHPRSVEGPLIGTNAPLVDRVDPDEIPW
jgi:hypothetical protein